MRKLNNVSVNTLLTIKDKTQFELVCVDANIVVIQTKKPLKVKNYYARNATSAAVSQFL